MYASTNIAISFTLVEEISAENSSMRKTLFCLFRNCSTQLDSEIFSRSNMFGHLSMKVFCRSKLQYTETDLDTAAF